MPSRNAARTIRAAIRSVQSQTFPDWELVIVDDGSTDETRHVALQEASSDARIRVIASPPLGRGAARNLCLEHSRGRFIAICDSDDISLPDRFSVQLRAFEQSPLPDVVTSARVIAFSTIPPRSFAVIAPCTHEAIASALRHGRMPLLFATAMLRRELFTRFGAFDVALQRNQDFGFFLRVFKSVRFSTVPESLILYRTTGMIARWHFIAENNLFRRVALLRSLGHDITAAEYSSSLAGVFFRRIVTPLQYVWYIVKRALLRRGVSRLTPGEEAVLTRVLSALRESGGSRLL